MSQYEQRLATDKQRIRDSVTTIGTRVGQAIAVAVEGLIAQDHRRCYEVVLGDLPINREIRDADRRCHAFVARHLPSAGHLRFISSTMRLTVAIERVGDYAVTIAREAVQLGAPPPAPLAERLRRLADKSRQMLAQAVQAYGECNEALARNTKPLAREVHRGYDQTFRDLLTRTGERPVDDLFALLAVFNQLERVSDQAKNICEETLFELTGETKPAKIYRILFVGCQGASLPLLAVAMARKAFPQSGLYDCAAIDPVGPSGPDLELLGPELGLDLASMVPAPRLDSIRKLDRYHVIVALGDGARAAVRQVPFHTVWLEWRPSQAAARDDPAGGAAAIARALSVQLHDLMFTLRGESAG